MRFYFRYRDAYNKRLYCGMMSDTTRTAFDIWIKYRQDKWSEMEWIEVPESCIKRVYGRLTDISGPWLGPENNANNANITLTVI